MRDLVLLRPYRAGADVLLGAAYKTFEAGTQLMRASQEMWHRTSKGKRYGWYAPGHTTTDRARMRSYEREGAITRDFTTTRDVRLLDMGKVETLKFLQQQDEKLHQLVDAVFPIGVDGIVRRKSSLEDDQALADALLARGLLVDGWYHDDMTRSEGGPHLSEVLLVDPHEKAVGNSSVGSPVGRLPGQVASNVVPTASLSPVGSRSNIKRSSSGDGSPVKRQLTGPRTLMF